MPIDLQREAARPWSHRYLRDQVRENPRLGPSFRARALAMESWDGFTILPARRAGDMLRWVAAGLLRITVAPAHT